MILLNMDYFRNWQQWYKLVCVCNIKNQSWYARTNPNRITALTTKQEQSEEGHKCAKTKQNTC